MRALHSLFLIFCFLFLISESSVAQKIPYKLLLGDSVVSTGHIGISIYEPSTGKYWYNYNATKYFVPSSNTKLFTLYAGMKYLGDSLVGLEYEDLDTAINIFPTGDPTFLHPDFKDQPILRFLQAYNKTIYLSYGTTVPEYYIMNSRKFLAAPAYWRSNRFGKGWVVDDQNEDYMPERSPFPVAGNIVHFKIDSIANYRPAGYSQLIYKIIHWNISPAYFKTAIDSIYILPIRIAAERQMQDSSIASPELLKLHFDIKKDADSNYFEFREATTKFKEQEVPFFTDGVQTAVNILKKDYGLNIKNGRIYHHEDLLDTVAPNYPIYKIHSQPSDSLFKPMMHRSDNFFAEQTLLMASNEHIGYMNDDDMIDTLLKTDLKDVPQKPRWVDGCGLSRYNLFTPQDFVYILNKMKDEFGLKRLEIILPTGNEGTLKDYYVQDSSFIYAKTGSMSNHFSLSGFLITKKNKTLVFSILLNDFMGSGTQARRAIEQFLEDIREKN